jgi:hypothetical protein
MATQRPAFAKRDREMKLKDKARAKAERREARKATPRAQKGPPIEADETTGEAGPSAQPTAGATPGTAASPAAGTAAPRSRLAGPSAHPTAGATPATAAAPAGTAAPGGMTPGGTTSRRPG